MPLRQREEVQEMPRVIIPVLFAILAHGAVLPDQIGTYKRTAPQTVGVPDQALYAEFGLDSTEQADYKSGSRKFSATVWRLHDSTGALALFDARRPEGATTSDLTKLAVHTSDGTIFAFGNYVFQITGNLPPGAEVKALLEHLPKVDQTPLPALMTFLPPEDLIPDSERYIVGPVSLSRFASGIPASVAAFHTGSEGISGKYRTSKGILTLTIFSFPTPNLARAQAEEMQKIAQATVRRVGSLVAVTIGPPNSEAAGRILANIHYEANVTFSQQVPASELQNKIQFILDLFKLSGLLILLCLAAGIVFGGYRILSRKLNRGVDPDAMIELHLGE
jgi:hypothetical protein